MKFSVVFFSLLTSVATGTAEQPLIRYDFTTEACQNGTFADLQESLPPLIRDASATSCSSGMGAESQISYSSMTKSSHLRGSQDSLEPLFHRIQEEDSAADSAAGGGITLSLWIKPFEDVGEAAPILTIGPENNALPPLAMGLSECDDRQVDFQLSVQKGVLELVYRTTDPYFEPCQRLRLRDLKLREGRLYHVAIALGDQRQQVFVNGQPGPMLHQPFDGTLSHWNTESILRFFSSNYHPLPWNGQIYQFSIHGELWDEANVRAGMALGLPPTQPFAISTRIRINEDNNLNAAEDDPSIITNEDPSGLPKMDLSIGFLDYEVEELLKSLDINDLPAAPRVHTYITKFPLQGDVYQVDGTKLVAGDDADAAAAIALQEPRLVYVPVHNEYSKLPGSTYASFDFCVTKQDIIFAASQCESSATISIVVDPVNDPPIAVVPTELYYTVHEGIQEEPRALKLTGIDVDIGDSIVSIQITSPPKLGHLYLSVPNYREDGLLHGTLLSSDLLLNYTVSGSEANVEYRFHRDSTDQVVQGETVTDSFRFRVMDTTGAYSTEATAHIRVLSSVSAVPPALLAVLEDDEMPTIELHGMDESGLNRTIGYFIDSVPPETDGVLLDSRNELVGNGALLESSAQGRAYESIAFVPSTEVCSTGTHANVKFSYRVVAFADSDDRRVVSASSVVQQLIRIECKIEPLVVSVPKSKYTTRAFDGLLDDPCSGYMYNVTESAPDSCPSVLVIDGIQATSHDTHAEPVFVSISTSKGLLTINRNYRMEIRTIEDQEEMRPSVMFFASANKLNDVLSSLHFQSEEVGDDEIRIVIRYGKCNFGHGVPDFSDLSSECFTTEETIQVEVLPGLLGRRKILFRKFPWIPLPFTLIMLCLIKVKGKVRQRQAVKEAEESEPKNEEECVDTTTVDDEESESIRWVQYYDTESGGYYYQHTEDGTVTWEPPLDEEFIAFEEDEEEE